MYLLVYCYLQVLIFFFFKQKTAYEMRISDWSSDVCSSDLARRGARAVIVAHHVEHDLGSNDQQFASVLEVHRYPVADHGLDLSDAPVRLLGMAHAHAGRQMQGIVQGCLLRHPAREVGRAATGLRPEWRRGGKEVSSTGKSWGAPYTS